MNLEVSDVLRACLRRWYVFIPILAITAWQAYGFYSSVKPVYYASAVVGATSSNEQTSFNPTGGPSPRNGLMDIGGAQLIMNMVVLGFDDPSVRARVVNGGGKGNFTVRMFPPPPSAAVQTALPLIMIEATEPDPASATRTVELAAQQADPILIGIQQQAGVPQSQMVKAINASSTKAVAGMPSRNKTVSLMLAFGVGLGVLVAVLLDLTINRSQKWLQARQREKFPVAASDDGADTQGANHSTLSRAD